MRILLVNRHFGEPHVPTGRILGDLARELKQRGHQVVVLTARSSYIEAAAEDDARAADQQFDGVEVHHTLVVSEKRRLLRWGAFLLQAWLRIPFMKWDRCLLLTDPPFLAAVSLLLRPIPRRHPRLYWWTMDLYPEIVAASGKLTETHPAYKALRWLNNQIIRRIGGVILLSQCQRERMREYPDWDDQISTIEPPWDQRPLRKVPPDQNRFLRKYQFGDKKIALYAGNLGEGHVYKPLLEAARLLHQQGRQDWLILFVAWGVKRQALEKEAQVIPTLRILDYQPMDWLPDLLWAADAHLITMRQEARGLVVPSKLYGVLQTDAPILFIGPGGAATADEIERYHAGQSLPPDASAESVIQTLDEIHQQAGHNPQRAQPDNQGPARIADFLCR